MEPTDEEKKALEQAALDADKKDSPSHEDIMKMLAEAEKAEAEKDDKEKLTARITELEAENVQLKKEYSEMSSNALKALFTKSYPNAPAIPADKTEKEKVEEETQRMRDYKKSLQVQ